MHIVKLGGSLYDSPHLSAWLQTLQQYAQQTTTVIVPGGGPFADCVRHAQQTHGFSDETAHHMALVAMNQFGLMLQSMLQQATSYRHRHDLLSPSGLHVWLPDSALMQIQDIPKSWQMTSDSLALWLAQQLSADRLSLVKSTTATSDSIQKLSDAGLVDSCFPLFYQAQPVEVDWFSDQQHEQFPAHGYSVS